MFVGHLAVALGAKKIAPALPLAALTSAAFGLDLLWPVFLLAGLEQVRIAPGDTAFTPLDFVSYPWSHSLAMTIGWAALAFVIGRVWTRQTKPAIVIGVLVASHWMLDLVTHRPDLPIWPDGPRYGWGLWNSIPATLMIEGALLTAGLVLYLKASRPKDRTGRVAFWALIVFVSGMWLSSPWSPPPPSVLAIAIVGLAFGLLTIPWTLWIERHRTPAR